MRILFTTDQIYLHGGIEKVMAEKSSYFADVYGYEVFILTTEQYAKPACYPLSPKIQLHDIAINYNREKSYFHPSNLGKLVAHYKKLNRAITEINPDVIINCNYASDFYWMPFIFKSIPKLKEYHSSRFYKDLARRNSKSVLKKIKFKWEDYVESRYDRLLLLNPDEKQFYRSDNLAVIPNPVSETDTIAALSNKKVLAAGRISPVKGFDNLIRSWEKVVAVCPDWTLDIYGEDYLNTKAQLQQLIVEKNLENHVNLAGVTNDMKNIMPRYSLYAMSSRTECFPMVLLEALAIGLPSVSFDCPTGPRNIITNEEDGYLCKDQDVEDLAQKLLLLISDDAKRKAFGQQAKRNGKRFENSVVMQQWKTLLTTLKT